MTASNFLLGGGAPLTVTADVGGDPGNPAGIFWRINGPTVGAFNDDITNTVPFFGVAPNNLVRLNGHINLLVDPGEVLIGDTNPNTFVPEPASLMLLVFGLPALLCRRYG